MVRSLITGRVGAGAEGSVTENLYMMRKSNRDHGSKVRILSRNSVTSQTRGTIYSKS